MDVYLPLGTFWAQSPRSRVEDDSAFSQVKTLLPRVSASRAPAPTSHLLLQMSLSAGPKHQGHFADHLPNLISIMLFRELIVTFDPRGRNLGQSVIMFLQKIVQHVFSFSLRLYLMVFSFVRSVSSFITTD